MTGAPIPLASLLTANPFLKDGFAPDELPTIEGLALAVLSVDIDAATGAAFFSGGIDGNMSVPLPGSNKEVVVQSARISLHAFLANPRASLLAFDGIAEIAGATAHIHLVLRRDSIQFTAEIENIDPARLVEAQFDIKANLPSLMLDKAYITLAGGNVSLGGRLSTDLQIPVGRTTLSPRVLWAEAAAGRGAATARLAGEAVLGRTPLAVETQLDSSALVLAGTVPRLSLRQLVEDLLGTSAGVPEFSLDDVAFEVSSAGSAHLSAADIRIDLQTMTSLLKLELPSGAPSPELSLGSKDDARALVLTYGGPSIRPIDAGGVLTLAVNTIRLSLVKNARRRQPRVSRGSRAPAAVPAAVLGVAARPSGRDGARAQVRRGSRRATADHRLRWLHRPVRLCHAERGRGQRGGRHKVRPSPHAEPCLRRGPDGLPGADPPLLIDDNGHRSWIRIRKLGFAPIKLGADAAWCVATEEEFKGPIAEYAVADGMLSPRALDGLFEAVPAGTSFSDRGFVIFLVGCWEIQSIAGMHCQFGIAHTRDAGFQTGIRRAASPPASAESSAS